MRGPHVSWRYTSMQGIPLIKEKIMKQHFIVTVEGSTPEALEQALKAAGSVLVKGQFLQEVRAADFCISPLMATNEQPPRDVTPEYALSHITDLAKLADEDIPNMVRELPGLIAMMKLAAADGTKDGLNLAEVMPVIRYSANDSQTVTVRSETDSFEASGQQMQAGWARTKLADGCPGSPNGHHVVRDDDAPQHGSCQNCDKVVRLG